jgi:hypothetical protein
MEFETNVKIKMSTLFCSVFVLGFLFLLLQDIFLFTYQWKFSFGEFLENIIFDFNVSILNIILIMTCLPLLFGLIFFVFPSCYVYLFKSTQYADACISLFIMYFVVLNEYIFKNVVSEQNYKKWPLIVLYYLFFLFLSAVYVRTVSVIYRRFNKKEESVTINETKENSFPHPFESFWASLIIVIALGIMLMLLENIKALLAWAGMTISEVGCQ